MLFCKRINFTWNESVAVMRVENMSLECLFYPPDTALSQGLVLAVLLYIFITGGLACELNLLFRKRGLK